MKWPWAQWQWDRQRPGWVVGARRVMSPYCNPRPAGQAVELVVLHGISLPLGQFGGSLIEALFSGQLFGAGRGELATLQVAAHFLLRRDGELLQFVPVHLRAWHAGPSSFQGRIGCNDFSVGIELEGTDDTPYTDPQYQGLTTLLRLLFERYPNLPKFSVVGHEHIAPGRKTDPGASFDWARLGELLDVRLEPCKIAGKNSLSCRTDGGISQSQ